MLAPLFSIIENRDVSADFSAALPGILWTAVAGSGNMVGSMNPGHVSPMLLQKSLVRLLTVACAFPGSGREVILCNSNITPSV